jgi:DNA-directed RNA polymerase subunit RPC12/RpoP
MKSHWCIVFRGHMSKIKLPQTIYSSINYNEVVAITTAAQYDNAEDALSGICRILDIQRRGLRGVDVVRLPNKSQCKTKENKHVLRYLAKYRCGRCDNEMIVLFERAPATDKKLRIKCDHCKNIINTGDYFTRQSLRVEADTSWINSGVGWAEIVSPNSSTVCVECGKTWQHNKNIIKFYISTVTMRNGDLFVAEANDGYTICEDCKRQWNEV